MGPAQRLPAGQRSGTPHATPVNLLFWQPVVSGKQFLQQFLRLKVASEMLASESKGVMERLRGQLRQGEAIEIAGYLLAPALAQGLEQADLLLPHRSGRVEWIEISGRADASLSPAATARLTQWQAAGQDARGTGQRSRVLADDRDQRVSGAA
jgi:hypothetical protein